jgi:hypothetical protein
LSNLVIDCIPSREIESVAEARPEPVDDALRDEEYGACATWSRERLMAFGDDMDSLVAACKHLGFEYAFSSVGVMTWRPAAGFYHWTPRFGFYDFLQITV